MIPEGVTRAALIFAVSVLAPSMVLGVLAFRTLKDQELVIETEKARASQSECEVIAAAISNRVASLPGTLQSFIAQFTKTETADPAVLAQTFPTQLPMTWQLAKVGFVANQTALLTPQPDGALSWFNVQNNAWFGNRIVSEAYVNEAQSMEPAQQAEKAEARNKSQASQTLRNVYPIKGKSAQNTQEETSSSLITSQGSFASLIADAKSGSIARFTDNQLQLLIWSRFPLDDNYVFGAEIRIDQLVDSIRNELNRDSYDKSVCFAIIDDQGKLRGTSIPFTPPNIRRPFVSVEIGETLPHWEISAYLVDPDDMSRGVAQIWWLVAGLIVALLASIAGGGGLVLLDVRRQIRFARERSDFVSNVSHELKTPLTSIRMFSEMLCEERVSDPGKKLDYLKRIQSESGRLTRLINNVLDFARMEKKELRYFPTPLDMEKFLQEELAEYPEVEVMEIPTPLIVRGDRDGLSQIFVNLISNARKYAAGSVLRLELQKTNRMCRIRFQDQGPGVPKKFRERVFRRFVRLDNSMASGAAGAGIGLSLARQIARELGGDLKCVEGSGPGACFELEIPLLMT